MERLTRKEKDGTILIERHTEVQDCLSNYMLPSDIAAVHRLAAYEDTGLEPEQAAALKAYIDRKAVMMVTEIDGMPIDRVRELVVAKQEGRLVVLPCKVGDTVWFIRPLDRKREIIETTIEKMVAKGKGIYMKLACNAMYETSCNSIGKTVFLSREEAERALEANKNIGDKNKKPTE